MFHFLFQFFFDENRVSNQNSSRWNAVFAASHLGLFCLPVSQKRTPGLFGLKEFREMSPRQDILLVHGKLKHKVVYDTC